jgi:hypothetical protein
MTGMRLASKNLEIIKTYADANGTDSLGLQIRVPRFDSGRGLQ